MTEIKNEWRRVEKRFLGFRRVGPPWWAFWRPYSLVPQEYVFSAYVKSANVTIHVHGLSEGQPYIRMIKEGDPSFTPPPFGAQVEWDTGDVKWETTEEFREPWLKRLKRFNPFRRSTER